MHVRGDTVEGGGSPEAIHRIHRRIRVARFEFKVCVYHRHALEASRWFFRQQVKADFGLIGLRCADGSVMQFEVEPGLRR